MTHALTPLTLPTSDAEWLSFAGDRADEHLARAEEGIAELKDGSSRSAIELLELFDDVEFDLATALHASYLISESHPDERVRDAAEARIERGSAISTGIAIDRELWRVFADADATQLDDEAERLYSHIMRDFRRGGVTLDDNQRERVRTLHERDTELGLEFARNVRDGKREIRVHRDRLVGLPQDFIDAHSADADGFVTVTTEYPDLMPLREYARDRALREEIVAAYNDLAWPENDAVLSELLDIRQELASILGFSNWADYETETRMIGSGSAIQEFLGRVDLASRDASAVEYQELLARLRADHPDAQHVTIADFWYLLGVLRHEDYDVDAQLVRSYFPFEKVLDGVLDVTARLFDLRYEPIDVPSWHEDVVSYDVFRETEHLGRIYLDLHPRDGKYNHAACFGLAPGREGLALPEGALLCNFSRGLMEHDEVVTFFHEFGHLVHAIVGGHQRWTRFSGVATEWDFVEAPSQMLEEWAWDADVLASFTANAEGEAIPADLVARMRRADAFGRALEVRRQLGHAAVSYGLHVERPADLQAATEAFYAQTSPVQPLPGGHSYAGFGHLTGYGACYYTYQWSLVIARDLLSAFGNALLDEDVARRYREEILVPGGSRDAADLVHSFLGRDYAFDAYQKWLAGE